jgi:anti-sigma regulatory factor (Ser/Thr protein kinase)
VSQSPALPPQPPGAERCVLNGDYSALANLATWCAHVADAHQLSPRSAHALDLCLCELVTNIIEYAYPAAGPASIVVDAAPATDTVEITLWDAGPEFNPLEQAAPQALTELSEVRIGGLGIDLVRKFTRQLGYARVGAWNRLRFSPAG